LKITVCVLLLKDNTNGLFDIDKEAPRARNALLVVGHSLSSHVGVLVEERCPLWVVSMDM